MCRINPRVDFAFKKLFGSEENKDLLISLINSIITPEDEIVDVTLKNPYTLKNYQTGKMSVLDIRATDEKNRLFNVEMQIGEDLNFDKRALYYWSKLVTEELVEGQFYKKLTKTFSINILDFSITDNEEYHNKYQILNAKTKKSDKLHDIFEMHYIELPHFRKDYKEIATALDRWTTFLTRAHELDKQQLPKELSEDEKIKKAIEAVDRMFNEDERAIYENRKIAIMDYQSKIDSAEEKGREEGMEKGMEKGIEVGREEGEYKKALEAAKKMKKDGLPDETISKYTGLSKEIIQSLSS